MTPKPRCSVTIGHRRDDHQRVVHRHLHGVFKCSVGGAFVDVVDAEHVGEKQRVEFATFQDAGEIGPVFQRVVAVGAVVRVSPQAGRLVPDAVHVERVEADLLAHTLGLCGAAGAAVKIRWRGV